VLWFADLFLQLLLFHGVSKSSGVVAPIASHPAPPPPPHHVTASVTATVAANSTVSGTTGETTASSNNPGSSSCSSSSSSNELANSQFPALSGTSSGITSFDNGNVGAGAGTVGDIVTGTDTGTSIERPPPTPTPIPTLAVSVWDARKQSKLEQWLGQGGEVRSVMPTDRRPYTKRREASTSASSSFSASPAGALPSSSVPSFAATTPGAAPSGVQAPTPLSASASSFFPSPSSARSGASTTSAGFGAGTSVTGSGTNVASSRLLSLMGGGTNASTDTLTSSSSSSTAGFGAVSAFSSASSTNVGTPPRNVNQSPAWVAGNPLTRTSASSATPAATAPPNNAGAAAAMTNTRNSGYVPNPKHSNGGSTYKKHVNASTVKGTTYYSANIHSVAADVFAEPAGYFQGVQLFFFRFIVSMNNFRFNHSLLSCIMAEISSLMKQEEDGFALQQFSEKLESEASPGKISAVTSMSMFLLPSNTGADAVFNRPEERKDVFISPENYALKVVKLTILGRFLGLLHFYSDWVQLNNVSSSTNCSNSSETNTGMATTAATATATATTTPLHKLVAERCVKLSSFNMTLPVLKLLQQADTNQNLTLAIPWVCGFLSMMRWDSTFNYVVPLLMSRSSGKLQQPRRAISSKTTTAQVLAAQRRGGSEGGGFVGKSGNSAGSGNINTNNIPYWDAMLYLRYLQFSPGFHPSSHFRFGGSNRYSPHSYSIFSGFSSF
jgi:hypothetical protein